MSLYEMFFEMELSLCDKFPALTPFQIRREKAREVFLLVKRLKEHNQKNNEPNNRPNVIRRPAGDDWF